MRTGNEMNIRETAAKIGYGAVMRMVVNHKYLCFNAFQSALKTLKTLLWARRLSMLLSTSWIVILRLEDMAYRCLPTVVNEP